jgi:hypothetical protein
MTPAERQEAAIRRVECAARELRDAQLELDPANDEDGRRLRIVRGGES